MEAAAGLIALWWIGLWVASAIVCALAGESRGRSGAGWFFMGLLCGPVGLLMLIAFAGRESTTEKFQMNTRTHRQCPVCREIVRIDAARCKYCTSQITPPKTATTPPAPLPEIAPTIPAPRQVNPQ